MTATLSGGVRAARTDVSGVADRLRLRLYGAALLVAAALYLLAEGVGRGSLFWLAALLCASAIGWGLARGPSGAVRAGAVGLLALSTLVPLGLDLAAGQPLETLRFWPQILVALFANRLLAEESNLRFSAFWRDPAAPQGAVQAQSTAAAVAGGLCLTLVFYQGVALLGLHRAEGTTLGIILRNAVLGETGIHRAIIVLFGVILAFAGEAALIHRHDRAAFRSLQRLARSAGNRDLGHLLAGQPALAGTRVVALVQDALAARTPDHEDGAVLAIQSFQLFHAAARRFVRGLLPFLPLLGFFGTVVGLATAMAALPHGAGENGLIDISASLAGLAVKFETTLLGIAASMVASLALSALEREEAELAAQCALFVDAVHAPVG